MSSVGSLLQKGLSPSNNSYHLSVRFVVSDFWMATGQRIESFKTRGKRTLSQEPNCYEAMHLPCRQCTECTNSNKCFHRCSWRGAGDAVLMPFLLYGLRTIFSRKQNKLLQRSSKSDVHRFRTLDLVKLSRCIQGMWHQILCMKNVSIFHRLFNTE
jgi:hypothetical protein